jgi:Ca2+-binding EF-hand superfamily protein
MNKIISTLALALAVTSLSAFGQDATATPAGKAGHEKKHQHAPLVAALDANGDGVIDAQEIANAPAALKTLDKNGDGQLTRDEYQAVRPESEKALGMKDGEKTPKAKNGGKKHHGSPLLNALDANGDGVIDAQEIANAPAALKTLDKNGDGQLTRDEYHAAGEKKQGKQQAEATPAPTAS